MIELTYPFDKRQICALRAGDSVAVSGLIFTGRDRLHKYLYEGGAAPLCLRDGALYHCGPVITPAEGGGWHVVAAGPTTSIREEPYMAKIIAEHGVRVIIGKGGMGAATAQACEEHGAVYLQTVGGAAALLAKRIQRVKEVHLLDAFGMAEAMWVLEVEKFEAVVGIDAHGGNLFEQIFKDSTTRLQTLLN